MELLLDTCTLIWTCLNDQSLPDNIKDIINNYDNDIYVSTASLWEIEIKHNKNPKAMPLTALEVYKAMLVSDFRLISPQPDYLFELGSITSQEIHRDPFDHLILAMAKQEKMTLVTHDKFMPKYDGIKILKY